jgi:hypothetical protein
MTGRWRRSLRLRPEAEAGIGCAFGSAALLPVVRCGSARCDYWGNGPIGNVG